MEKYKERDNNDTEGVNVDESETLQEEQRRKKAN